MITSILSPPSITGSTKTESITNTKLKSEEPNCTPSVPSTMPVCSTLPGSMPLPLLEDSPDGLDMTGTPIWKLISLNYHLPKLSRSSGTVPQSSSEDSLPNKSSRKTNTPLKPFSTRALKLSLLQLVKPLSWCAQLSALIWVAFPFHIWVTIMDTFAFVTVQCMTNSVESDKDLPSRTCHTLITQSTKTEPSSASKLSNSQENPLKDSGLDLFVLVKYFISISYSFPLFFMYFFIQIRSFIQTKITYCF